jgi:trehalose 2-sulfotransferase
MPTAADGTMQVRRIAGRLRRAAENESAGPPISLANQAFDLPGSVPLRRSYIIASTPRCGSAFLCARLWATGVLGAPAEYFAYQKYIATKMMERLRTSSPADYLEKLLACRTSNNGVFGANLDFNDFEEALRRLPEMLDVLSPVSYVFVDRRDQLIQAAYMARDVQSDTASRLTEQQRQRTIVRYDRDMISKWLGRIERQRLGWIRWFAANNIVPFVVTYTQLITHPAAAARDIVNLLGVQDDEPQKLRVALVDRPSDRVSEVWAARFEREIANGIEDRGIRPVDAAEASHEDAKDAGEAPHIFDRLDEINGIAAGSTAAKRSRDRYKAIIARNRVLFKNARVLDLRSGDGCWSLAALDAGAAHVVGVEGQPKALAAARNAFAEIGVEQGSYRFVNERMFEALNAFSPEEFDLILCREVSSDPHFFFQCLWRLRPKHIVLDTKITGQKEPSIAFTLRQEGSPGPKGGRRLASIDAAPNHALIKILCDWFGFHCRLINWRALGITDWTGVDDYKRNRRRTYVLDWTGAPEADPAS